MTYSGTGDDWPEVWCFFQLFVPFLLNSVKKHKIWYRCIYKTKPNNSRMKQATVWNFDSGLSKSSKVFPKSWVIFQLFVPFLLISEKEHKNIVCI